MSRGARTELGLAVALCLLGSCLVLVAASRTWVDLPVEGGPLLPDSTLEIEGSELVPGVRALALVGLAGVVALLASRRGGRVLVGGLLALCGLGVVAIVVRLLTRLDEAVLSSAPAREAVAVVLADSPSPTAWAALCLVGGVVLLAAGVLAAVRGRRWAVLSRRYEPPTDHQPAAEPATSTESSERAAWEALDRGEDPTRD
jgi:uncharacterized membrane protein (TIGR02234 family)